MAPSPPRLKILSGMWLRLRRTLCDLLLLSVLQCLTGLHIPPALSHVRQRILRVGGAVLPLKYPFPPVIPPRKIPP